MKKLFFSIALLAGISSCSLVKDVQQHCRVTDTVYDLRSGSFTGCLSCDSLAKALKDEIKKAQSKQ